LQIESDSLSNLKGITEQVSEWEDKDYIGIQNDKEWRLLVYLLRSRPATTEFKWVQAHNGTVGNEMADQLADIGREKEEEWDLDYAIPDHWRVDGARLAVLNQKLAYQILIHKKVPKPGSCSDTTRNNIEYTKDEVERVTGIRPTEKQIWKGISKKPIQRKKTDFLWKLLHDRVRCGKYFKHIPGWEDKQYCQCGEIENPEHIL
ncbi:hypothetical protein BD311DRAFT_605312, partial [Dichomitus squalens]